MSPMVGRWFTNQRSGFRAHIVSDDEDDLFAIAQITVCLGESKSILLGLSNTFSTGCRYVSRDFSRRWVLDAFGLPRLCALLWDGSIVIPPIGGN